MTTTELSEKQFRTAFRLIAIQNEPKYKPTLMVKAHGWEQGRKALIEDVKAEINKMPYVTTSMKTYGNKNKVLRIEEMKNEK